jgi:GT2 family glycosyltransferase
MPCWEEAAFLQEAVSSVLAVRDVETELILVDDGSRDPAFLRAFEAVEGPGIRKLRVSHGGPAAARNAGIRAAEGKYVLPLDADDCLESSFLSHAAAVLDTRPEVGIVSCSPVFMGARTGPWELPEPTPAHMAVDSCIPVTALFRKADWDAVGGFAEDLTQGLEDYDFFLALMERGLSCVRLPETGFRYRVKEASRSTLLEADPAAVRSAYDRIWQRHRAFLLEHMDGAWAALRTRTLTEGRALNGFLSDPVTAHWHALRQKGGLRIRLMDAWLALRDKLRG